MKLLFDQNLPWRLASLLEHEFPGSAHVSALGMTTASDSQIWDLAREHGFAIVSKDADFHHMSFLHGAPPKTIWVRMGNCTTFEIGDALLRQAEAIRAFLDQDEAALLVLGEG